MREEVGMGRSVLRCAQTRRIAAILLSVGVLLGHACPSGSQGSNSRKMVGHPYCQRVIRRFACVVRIAGWYDDWRSGRGCVATVGEANDNPDEAVRRTTWGRIKADFLAHAERPPRGKGEHR